MALMKCTIQPELTLAPASIPGPGGRVTIGFAAATQNISQIQATYEILDSKDYKFSPEDFTFHEVKTQARAYRQWDGVTDGDATYEEEFLIEPKQGSTGREAALKIVVSAVPIKGKFMLEPVHAIGSLAILSGTLKSLMQKAGGAPGGGTLQQQALQFVRDRIKSLDADPEFRAFLKANPAFKNFKWPADQTIVNALTGDTASRQSTIDALKPAIEFYKKSGLIETIKKEAFLKAGKGNKGAFKGIIKLVSKKSV